MPLPDPSLIVTAVAVTTAAWFYVQLRAERRGTRDDCQALWGCLRRRPAPGPVEPEGDGW